MYSPLSKPRPLVVPYIYTNEKFGKKTLKILRSKKNEINFVVIQTFFCCLRPPLENHP